MTDKGATYKAKLLSTDYPQWRNRLSCAALAALSGGAVLCWYYAYYTLPQTECYKGFLYISVLWLAVQWAVIGYLYWYRDIPAFARSAIKLLVLVANAWFGLFIFSLQPCG
ncbi:hypothetical protein GCM10027181_16570 [Rheinheimera gaetbuli]